MKHRPVTEDFVKQAESVAAKLHSQAKGHQRAHPKGGMWGTAFQAEHAIRRLARAIRESRRPVLPTWLHKRLPSWFLRWWYA